MNTKINNTAMTARLLALSTTLALAATSAGAATIGLWDGWDGATDGSTFVEADTFGLITTAPRVTEPSAAAGAFRDIDQTNRGSNDGTFGTIASPGAETLVTGGFRLEKGSAAADPTNIATLWVSIVNDTTQTISFDGLSFDAVYTFSGADDGSAQSKNAYALSFINQTTSVTTSGLGSGTFGTDGNATNGNFDDVNIDVSSIQLPAGETGVFSIDFSGSTSINPGSHFDNLLLTGDTIPEPTSVGLMALAGLALLRRRRN